MMFTYSIAIERRVYKPTPVKLYPFATFELALQTAATLCDDQTRVYVVRHDETKAVVVVAVLDFGGIKGLEIDRSRKEGV